MIKREIEICGKKIPFRSSATIPRLYRAKFKRDIFKDLSKLENSYVGTQKDGAEFQIDDLEIFENVARHRIQLNAKARLNRVKVQEIIEEILNGVQAPNPKER